MANDYVKHSDILSFGAEKVNIPKDYVTEYRNQVNGLRDRLKKYIDEHPDYNLVKMLHSGSIAKGTALKTLNDMDVAVYIKKSEEEVEEEKLLSWLMQRLKEANPNLKDEQFSPGGHCIKISFKGSGLDVDVSPIIYEDEKNDIGYLINKDTGDRVLTSIPLHLEFIRKRKAKLPQHYRQTIRLIKWWVRNQKKLDDSFRFKSFMVELICAHLFDNGINMTDYITAIEEFFLYTVKSGLKERIYFTDYYSKSELPKEKVSPIEIFDPVNPKNNVSAKYSESDRLKIVDSAHKALDAIHEARFATTKGRAVERWQQIFGSTFNF